MCARAVLGDIRPKGACSLHTAGRGEKGEKRRIRGDTRSSKCQKGREICPYIFLGLLRAPARNIPQRVRDTIRTIPKKWEPRPVLKPPRFTLFSEDCGPKMRDFLAISEQRFIQQCGYRGKAILIAEFLCDTLSAVRNR